MLMKITLNSIVQVTDKAVCFKLIKKNNLNIVYCWIPKSQVIETNLKISKDFLYKVQHTTCDTLISGDALFKHYDLMRESHLVSLMQKQQLI